MGTKIFIAVMILIYTLFLLSVFAPIHNEKKFWKAIRKIRTGMDIASYWFYILCTIATGLFLVYWAAEKLIMK